MSYISAIEGLVELEEEITFDLYRKTVFEKYIPQKYYDELYAKSLIIPNGIDDFWFNNQPSEKKEISNPVKLIYAGRIDKNKNIPTIKDAMDVLQRMGIKSTLTVIGRIVDESEFLKIKDDNRITYHSAMPKEQLIEQYRKHDIFVMPSFTESFGLVYAEAISQGLPVVYSKGQGFDGQFEEGVVGYHCNPRNSDDVAFVINKIREVFDVGKKIDLKKYRWNCIVKEYETIYDKCCRR